MPSQRDVTIRERLKEPPAPILVESYYKPGLARAIAHQFEPELWLHLAHCLMLRRQKIVSDADTAAILACLLAVHDTGPDRLEADGTLEDLYSYVDRHLVRSLGADVGGRLHTGR